jgi:ParB family chromosome partitioning protein
MERKVLGKGLEALIPKKPSMTAAASREFTHIPLSKINDSRFQPRQTIDKKELNELSRSIKERGVIQPIVVRKIPGERFEIVAGSRRFNAAKSLGLKDLPAIIRQLDDKETFVCAIVENLQRKNLNPIEEAESFKRLVDEFKFTLEDLATFIGKDKTTIVNTMRLLKLPEDIKDALKEGDITRSQARTILALDNKRDQQRLFRQIMAEGLSVREIETKVRRVSKKAKRKDPFTAEVEEKMQKLLGTKVRIFNKKNNRGRVVIEYYNLEDLERIVRRIK